MYDMKRIIPHSQQGGINLIKLGRKKVQWLPSLCTSNKTREKTESRETHYNNSKNEAHKLEHIISYQTYTFFISWKALMTCPAAETHNSKEETTSFSMSGISFRMDSGEREVCTSFLMRVWYSPWWKNNAEGPISFSLLLGYVGLNK